MVFRCQSIYVLVTDLCYMQFTVGSFKWPSGRSNGEKNFTQFTQITCRMTNCEVFTNLLPKLLIFILFIFNEFWPQLVAYSFLREIPIQNKNIGNKEMKPITFISGNSPGRWENFHQQFLKIKQQHLLNTTKNTIYEDNKKPNGVKAQRRVRRLSTEMLIIQCFIKYKIGQLETLQQQQKNLHIYTAVES